MATKYVPAAAIEEVAATEVTIGMPQDDLPAFASLFDELDGQKDALGISSYGLSLPTLQEVGSRK